MKLLWAVVKNDGQCRQAKLDALSGLSAAAEAYGATAMQPHLSSIWHVLRGELLAPAAASLLPADLASAQQVTTPESIKCLAIATRFLPLQLELRHDLLAATYVDLGTIRSALA